MVRYAKPDPDLFLAAAERLGVPIHNCVVVGDSIWDLLAAQRRAHSRVGVLSGGYGQEELERQAPIASTRIRAICWLTSMNWA